MGGHPFGEYESNTFDPWPFVASKWENLQGVTGLHLFCWEDFLLLVRNRWFKFDGRKPHCARILGIPRLQIHEDATDTTDTSWIQLELDVRSSWLWSRPQESREYTGAAFQRQLATWCRGDSLHRTSLHLGVDLSVHCAGRSAPIQKYFGRIDRHLWSDWGSCIDMFFPLWAFFEMVACQKLQLRISSNYYFCAV